MQRRVSSLAPLALLFTLATTLVAQSEPLAPTYQNLRGINYLAVYGRLEAYLGERVPGYTQTYWGSASASAMWFYYRPQPGRIPGQPPRPGLPGQPQFKADLETSYDVYEQLGWVRKSGFNAVRVFLSYPLWHFYHQQRVDGCVTSEHNEFTRRFEDFLDLCDQQDLYVIPVIWDSVGYTFQPRYASQTMPSGMLAYQDRNPIFLLPGEIAGNSIVPTPGCLSTPPGGFPQINLDNWHNSPGAFAVNTVDDLQTSLGTLAFTPDPNTTPTGPNDVAAFQVLNAGGNLKSTPAELFLQEMIGAFDDYQHVLLLWDVANEPHLLDRAAPSGFETLIAETMRIIKTYPANQPERNRTTCFSPVGVSNRIGHRATVRIATNLLATNTILRPDYGQSQAWNEANVGQPLCDVVAVHPYGHTRLTVDSRTFDAQHINPDPHATAMPAGLLNCPGAAPLPPKARAKRIRPWRSGANTCRGRRGGAWRAGRGAAGRGRRACTRWFTKSMTYSSPLCAATAALAPRRDHMGDEPRSCGR